MKTINTISIGLISLLFSVTSMSAAEPSPNAAPTNGWKNITAELAKTIGTDPNDGKTRKWNEFPNFQGMLVLPNGDVGALSYKGLYRSTDQGATWAKWGEDWMKGLAQVSVALKIYYPDRIGLTMDGPIAVSADLGKSWVRITSPKVLITYKRDKPSMGDINVTHGDMDLAANMPPKVIVGAVHHGDLAGGSFVQTTDGGATWDWAAPALKGVGGPGGNGWFRFGVVNPTTLLYRSNNKNDERSTGIHLSTDLGQNWTKVSDYTPIGLTVVHYGPNMYWAATEGVVVSRDGGKTWSICGSPIKNIHYGPYFGRSEREMMVVSASEGYFVTRDGGTTWTRVAAYFAPPDGKELDGNDKRGIHRYYGWDSEKNILYRSDFKGNVWKLQLGATPAAK